MVKKNVLYRCFNPQRVINKYTEQVIYADCGKCEACLNKRSGELASRIDREMLYQMKQGNSIYLVTLDYNNEHLPVFEEVPEEQFDGSIKNVWRSNRAERLPRYDYSPIVTDFYYPNGYGNTRCFGHLCYEDVLAYQGKVRTAFYDWFRRGNVFEVNEHFIEAGLSYDDVKYRYFLCGEYGPCTMRPHYHLLLWFSRKWTKEQERCIFEVIRKSWTLGSVDVQAVTSGGVKNYLSNYVTGYVGLPSVLRDKPLRPFCTFSKNPIIGSYRVDDEEIQEVLTRGTHSRSRFDPKLKEHTPDYLSPSYWRRYFPKCQGFSIKDFDAKLRIYRYAFDYFAFKGIKHTAENVDSVCLSDISFPRRLYSPLELEREYEEFVISRIAKKKRRMIKEGRYYFRRTEADGDDFVTAIDRKLLALSDAELDEFKPYEDWSYTDKYASLTCYKYCVKYNYSPEDFLRNIEAIYMKQDFERLKKFYQRREELGSDNQQYNPYV